MVFLNEALKFGLVELNPNFFFQIFNTLIMFLFLRKLLFKPVSEFIAKRQKDIADEIEAAETKNRDADALKAEYADRIKRADEEAHEIVRQAAHRAETRAAEILHHAEQEAVHIKAQAVQEIERERLVALNALKDEVAAMAVLAASRIVEKDLDENAHRAFIQQFINGVGDTKWQM